MADYEDEKENRSDFIEVIPQRPKEFLLRFEHFREVKAPSLQGQESQSSLAFRYLYKASQTYFQITDCNLGFISLMITFFFQTSSTELCVDARSEKAPRGENQLKDRGQSL